MIPREPGDADRDGIHCVAIIDFAESKWQVFDAECDEMRHIGLRARGRQTQANEHVVIVRDRNGAIKMHEKLIANLIVVEMTREPNGAVLSEEIMFVFGDIETVVELAQVVDCARQQAGMLAT